MIYHSAANPAAVEANVIFSPIEPIYCVEMKDGEPFLVKCGEVNVQESIQSHFEQADLASLLARCAATGNYDLIHQRVPVYGDCTGIPNDYTDAHRKYQKAMNYFNNLPKDLKKCYKDFNDFANQIIKNEPSDKVVAFYESQVQKPVEPSKGDVE